MGIKLSLNIESVSALRNWADGIVVATESIRFETEELLNTLNSNRELLGTHENSFSRLFLHLQKYQIVANEALEELPKLMNETADKIELYIYGNTDLDDDSGWQRVRKR